MRINKFIKNNSINLNTSPYQNYDKVPSDFDNNNNNNNNNNNYSILLSKAETKKNNNMFYKQNMSKLNQKIYNQIKHKNENENIIFSNKTKNASISKNNTRSLSNLKSLKTNPSSNIIIPKEGLNNYNNKLLNNNLNTISTDTLYNQNTNIVYDNSCINNNNNEYKSTSIEKKNQLGKIGHLKDKLNKDLLCFFDQHRKSATLVGSARYNEKTPEHYLNDYFENDPDYKNNSNLKSNNLNIVSDHKSNYSKLSKKSKKSKKSNRSKYNINNFGSPLKIDDINLNDSYIPHKYTYEEIYTRNHEICHKLNNCKGDYSKLLGNSINNNMSYSSFNIKQENVASNNNVNSDNNDFVFNILKERLENKYNILNNNDNNILNKSKYLNNEEFSIENKNKDCISNTSASFVNNKLNNNINCKSSLNKNHNKSKSVLFNNKQLIDNNVSNILINTNNNNNKLNSINLNKEALNIYKNNNYYILNKDKNNSLNKLCINKNEDKILISNSSNKSKHEISPVNNNLYEKDLKSNKKNIDFLYKYNNEYTTDHNNNNQTQSPLNQDKTYLKKLKDKEQIYRKAVERILARTHLNIDLTPIPKKKDLKNDIEKTVYFEAERTAVMLRKIEYSENLKYWNNELSNYNNNNLNVIPNSNISDKSLKYSLSQNLYFELIIETSIIRIQRWWRYTKNKLFRKNPKIVKIQAIVQGYLFRLFCLSRIHSLIKFTHIDNYFKIKNTKICLGILAVKYAKLFRINFMKDNANKIISLFRRYRIKKKRIINKLFDFLNDKYLIYLKNYTFNLIIRYNNIDEKVKLIQRNFRFYYYRRCLINNILINYNSNYSDNISYSPLLVVFMWNYRKNFLKSLINKSEYDNAYSNYVKSLKRSYNYNTYLNDTNNSNKDINNNKNIKNNKSDKTKTNNSYYLYYLKNKNKSQNRNNNTKSNLSDNNNNNLNNSSLNKSVVNINNNVSFKNENCKDSNFNLYLDKKRYILGYVTSKLKQLNRRIKINNFIRTLDCNINKRNRKMNIPLFIKNAKNIKFNKIMKSNQINKLNMLFPYLDEKSFLLKTFKEFKRKTWIYKLKEYQRKRLGIVVFKNMCFNPFINKLQNIKKLMLIQDKLINLKKRINSITYKEKIKPFLKNKSFFNKTLIKAFKKCCITNNNNMLNYYFNRWSNITKIKFYYYNLNNNLYKAINKLNKDITYKNTKYTKPLFSINNKLENKPHKVKLINYLKNLYYYSKLNSLLTKKIYDNNIHAFNKIMKVCKNNIHKNNSKINFLKNYISKLNNNNVQNLKYYLLKWILNAKRNIAKETYLIKKSKLKLLSSSLLTDNLKNIYVKKLKDGTFKDLINLSIKNNKFNAINKIYNLTKKGSIYNTIYNYHYKLLHNKFIKWNAISKRIDYFNKIKTIQRMIKKYLLYLKIKNNNLAQVNKEWDIYLKQLIRIKISLKKAMLLIKGNALINVFDKFKNSYSTQSFLTRKAKINACNKIKNVLFFNYKLLFYKIFLNYSKIKDIIGINDINSIINNNNNNNNNNLQNDSFKVNFISNRNNSFNFHINTFNFKNRMINFLLSKRIKYYINTIKCNNNLLKRKVINKLLKNVVNSKIVLIQKTFKKYVYLKNCKIKNYTISNSNNYSLLKFYEKISNNKKINSSIKILDIFSIKKQYKQVYSRFYKWKVIDKLNKLETLLKYTNASKVKLKTLFLHYKKLKILKELFSLQINSDLLKNKNKYNLARKSNNINSSSISNLYKNLNKDNKSQNKKTSYHPYNK